ncbi:hypothetical protein NBRC3188_3091 [Acetobacter pasteurianus NBRC 3188]|uniref:Uncharacterized protein n=1 Tax=Acetobacter pasteurianus NBRC 3188 TaxID=1226663 RepID=A0A401WYM3_ACEPA|nr:hypothetical protein NBRC3188_3091 [Acetobacter pasteurianus NBRC 3188]
MSTQGNRAARSRQTQVTAIKGPWHQIVVSLVIELYETVRPVGILPHPLFERALDSRQFFLGGFRFLCIEFASFVAILIAPMIPYFGNGLRERVFQKFRCIASFRAPDGCCFSARQKRRTIDTPACHFRGMTNGCFNPHDLLYEVLNVRDGQPRRSQTGCNFRGTQISRLHTFKGADIACISLIMMCGLACERQFGAHRT